ncbi:MAG TPA: type II secretion system F family protein [Polyangiaceae bacterium]|nr:type II secretion system F family protein [Polyangiaceae bacterium]
MSPFTFWLGRGTVLGVVLTLSLTAWAAFGERSSPGRAAAREYTACLDKHLAFLRATISGTQVLWGQVCCATAASTVALVFGTWPALLFVPALAFGPKVLIEWLTARRVAKLEEQIESWLVAIANALKASPSLGEAIASTVSLVQAPISQELDVIVKENELGTPLDRALQNFADRVESSTLSGAVLALQVARKAGGNLPEMLESAAAALRELARLEGVVRTKTAEGKAQAFVIGLIPVPLVAGVRAMDPEFFRPLAETFAGNLVIAGAAALWIAAILMARKILAVDV